MKRALVTLIIVTFAVFASTAAAETTDAHGNTPLMAAAATGDTATVQQLIDKGVEVNAQGRIGNTALIYAAQEGHSRVVELLVEAGAEIETHNDFNATAYKLAEGYGYSEITATLEHATLQAAATPDNDRI